MRPPEPAIPQRLVEHSIGFHCTECLVTVPVAPRQLISALIAATPVHCPACAAEYDVWNRMVDQLTFGAFGSRYAAVGANLVSAEVRLQRDQPIFLDFQKFGIPETAEIEEIVLTPAGEEDGWLQPVFPKDPEPGQSASKKLLIYPLPIGGGAEENQASILIVWIAPTGPDPAQDVLLAGVRAAHRHDHLGAIVSSNSAMELALGSAMNGWLESHGIGRTRRNDFLTSDATYGSQLSVLLPVAAKTIGLKPVPQLAQAALSRLRKLRNEVAHGGLQAATITDADLAQCLAGAAVGVIYCEALATHARRDLERD